MNNIKYNILNKLKNIIKKFGFKEYIKEYGDWGLGIGDWGLGPIPNPQSPIPNPQSPFVISDN